jgi:hypothetical protein
MITYKLCLQSPWGLTSEIVRELWLVYFAFTRGLSGPRWRGFINEFSFRYDYVPHVLMVYVLMSRPDFCYEMNIRKMFIWFSDSAAWGPHLPYHLQYFKEQWHISTVFVSFTSKIAGRVKTFHFSISCRPALGSTQPPIKWVSGALSPGVKWQGREADHSPPTSAEVKKMWIYTSTPPYVFMA